MQLKPQGDHYIWYCDWCDTRNATQWVRIERNRVCCAACQKTFTVFDEARKRCGDVTASFQLL